MLIHESGEIFLQTILILSAENSHVRSIDVSEYMGFSKPSVSRAIGILRNGGYVEMDKDGYLTLTDLGLSVAQKVYDRHNIITDFLISIGVSEETAASDACKIEHHISDESFEAIKNFIKK